MVLVGAGHFNGVHRTVECARVGRDIGPEEIEQRVVPIRAVASSGFNERELALPLESQVFR